MTNLNIFEDELYLTCINESVKSKSDSERYGAVLVYNDNIIGKGFNRRIIPEDTIRMGYANHAEVNTINDALLNNTFLEGSVIYVAGYFPKEGYLFLKEESAVFTCKYCPKHLINYGIDTIYTPSLDGWKLISSEEALSQAQTYWGDTHNLRLDTIIKRHKIEELI